MATSLAPSPTQTSHHASRPTIPTGLVPVAVLVAAAAGLLALLPSLAQAVWEVPHLFLLGAVISFGVFTQRNNNDDADGNGNAASAKDRSLAWNARYHPDDPLVVIADHHAVPSDDDDDNNDAMEGARERPLSLPVRRLKPSPPAAAQESETGGDASDGFGEETDSCASSSGFWAGARAAVPSPPSVLDADQDFSPCSQPQSDSERPFFVQHSSNKSRGSNAATETPPTVPRGFVQEYQYHPSAPDGQPLSDDGEVTDDWGEDAADGSDDEMTTPVSSERSVRGDDFDAYASDHNDGDDTSVDEELLKLAAKSEPDGEAEVDKKADEFIAKFREQIRLQRH